jgi:hopene-associated glycosyltransferase HpnB
MDFAWLALLSLILWLIIWILPWRPWSTDESLDASPPSDPQDLSDITVLIPARNESSTIAATLTGLAQQGRNHKIILIDDQSEDATSEIAERLRLEQLWIVMGQALPVGWTGKLWALEQGLGHVATELTLLLDADIELQPGVLSALRRKMKTEGLQLVSLMAKLKMEGFWEKLLLPAFVYFFKLIYPFSLSNSPSNRYVAAAAGGCILIETRVLRQLGGFAAIKGALIDDCTLASKVKSLGGRTWIGLTHSAISLRAYPTLASVWTMVARTAFTQLHYSYGLLLFCALIMALAYLVPLAGLFSGDILVFLISLASLSVLSLTYLPTLKYYGIGSPWVMTLPLVGVLYLAMTFSSAAQYLRGNRAKWKGRTYPGHQS